jgi:exonuclease SbcC
MLDRALAEARGALKQALDAENEANQLSLELEQARRALTSLSAELVKLRDHEQSNAGEARTLRATVRAKGSTLTGTTSRLDIALSAALPDWKDRVADLGMGFAETCRGLVNEWRRRRQSAETTGSEISRLEASLEGQLATLRAAEVGFTADETRLAEKQKDLDSLVVDRAGVIEGRPVGDVRSEYRERSEAADEEWNNAEVVRSAAERLAATRSSEVVAASKVLEATNRDSATAERLLAEKLSVTQISRADAEAALVRGEAWAAEEQIRLETLRSAVTTAMVTLADRRDAIEQHVVQGQPDLDQHEAETALLDIGARQANAMARYVKISGEVQQDSQARARMAEIKVALGERREKAHVWNRLEELIGSADGARFRRFAQSLTLLHLIQLANRHLADLHPRYELQRAPGSDLVLQVVDRNMADEVRGVHSLSGGERFLVSLSLALGLASMSSGRGIKIESLFIDEGFGALDSNSLAMAVSVLEQLQATGRRVAVISHVDELKERIAVRVEVTPVGSGRSTVQVVTG